MATKNKWVISFSGEEIFALAVAVFTILFGLVSNNLNIKIFSSIGAIVLILGMLIIKATGNIIEEVRKSKRRRI